MASKAAPSPAPIQGEPSHQPTSGPTKTGREIRVNLPGAATAFAVPDGFLLPGTAYKLAVGTVSRAGNRSVVETEFTTARKK